MKNNKTLKSILQVGMSNFVTMLVGILTGFIVPKLLSIDGYGIYKTFTLYLTYIGLCSLGIVDGIVLEYGGKDYDQLDKSLFRAYFKGFTIVNFIFASILFLATTFFIDEQYKFVFLMVSINIIFLNITGYYQQISQITLRFKEYSIVRFVQSLLNILLVGFLFLNKNYFLMPKYELYILGVCLINCFNMLWYLVRYKDITFGTNKSLKLVVKDLLMFIKIGFPLLFANITSTLILTLDRQFVNIYFDNTTYAKYSFAYSMVSLVTVATSAIATVIYPTLKRKSSEDVKSSFTSLVSIILIIISFLISSYFPLKLFIEWFLPKYSDSLVLFRIIFPGIIISSAVTVIMHNYYKVLGKNIIFFKKSIIVLVISVLLNLIVVYFFKNSIYISYVFIITMIIWYLYVEKYFVNYYGYNSKQNFFYLINVMVIFYTSSYIKNDYLALFIYLVALLLSTILFFKNRIKNFILFFKA